VDLLADEAEHVRASGVTVTLGVRRRFAAGVGEWDNGPRQVDLWAAGKWLTCDDNMAFVQQFRLAVLDTAAWLHAGHVSPLPFGGLSPEATHRRLMLRAGADGETEAEYAFRRRFRIMDWGPTTDNVAAHAFREADRLVVRHRHHRRYATRELARPGTRTSATASSPAFALLRPA
jgi:hypothetical protein